MRLVIVALVVVLCESNVGAQQPTGPVGPVVASGQNQTVASFGKVLKELLDRDADGELWDASTQPKRWELIETVEALSKQVQIPIGPVPPRPPNPPPPPPPPGTPVPAPIPPAPVPPKPPEKPVPTKDDFEEALEELQLILEQSARKDPNRKLSLEPARGLRTLVDQLRKISRP